MGSSPILSVITTHQRSCEKVMFSVMSLHHSVHSRGSHVITIDDALDHAVEALPSPRTTMCKDTPSSDI